MESESKGYNWRIGYAIFCLLFGGWVIYLGLDNFDKVHSEYRQSVNRLHPDQIRKIAARQLTDQCLNKLKHRGISREDGTIAASAGAGEAACLSFPQPVREEQEKTVGQQLQIEKKRLLRKLVVFTISFALFFLALPLFLLYLLLAFLIWVFRDMKFIR